MLPKYPLYYHTFGAPLAGRTFKAEEAQYQLVNDNFTDAITGWVANISSGYTMVIDDGRLKFDAGIPWAGIIKTFTTVPGKKYHISVKVDMGTTQALYLIVRNVGNVNNTVVAATANGAYEIDFTAVDATTTFHLEGLNGSSTATRTFYIDDVLIQEATNKTYRFGFNGKENDNETQTQDYGARIYDIRLGRFLSVDPLTYTYPFYSPYLFAGNSPIRFIDVNGEGIDDNPWSSVNTVDANKLKPKQGFNSLGWPRNASEFWQLYAQTPLGEIALSEANLKNIANNKPVVVDAQWNSVMAQWDLDGKIGESLHHHHVNKGRSIIGVPASKHIEGQYASKNHGMNSRVGKVNKSIGRFTSFISMVFDVAGYLNNNPDSYINWFRSHDQLGVVYKINEPNREGYFVFNEINKTTNKDGSYSITTNYTVFENYAWSEKQGKYVGVNAVGNYSNTVNYDKDKKVVSETKGNKTL